MLLKLLEYIELKIGESLFFLINFLQVGATNIILFPSFLFIFCFLCFSRLSNLGIPVNTTSLILYPYLSDKSELNSFFVDVTNKLMLFS